MRRWVLLVALVATACGPAAAPTTTTTTTLSSTDATYARPTEPSTTSTTMLTTFGTTATTVPPTTSTVVAQPTLSVPTLDDGRPTTWLGVTSDYVAVEVSTATGATVHTFGQTGTREEVDNALEIGPNVITASFRLRDGSVIGLVDCCEPAGGVIYYVEAGGTLDGGIGLDGGTDGWALTAAPTTPEFARLGYSVGVFDPLNFRQDRAVFWADEPELGFPSGQVAWNPDGSVLYWIGIEFDTGRTTLNRVDLNAEFPAPQAIGVLDWVGERHSLGYIATQASGNLVGFLHTLGDGTVTASQGVVFNPAGELLVTFPVERDSVLGSYDASGKYLIYVDGDGIVRWQGRGQSGELGAGYIHASW